MQLNHLIQPQIELLQLIQRLIERDHIGHIHPRRERAVGVRHGQERHARTAFFGIAFAHKIDHDGAQHFTDIGEKLQPRLPLQALAFGHAHEAFVHQRRGVEPGDATGLGELAARQPLDIGIEARKQRPHRVGIAVGGALYQKGGGGRLHQHILQWIMGAAASCISFSLKARWHRG